jgi:hypothetical protein
MNDKAAKRSTTISTKKMSFTSDFGEGGRRKKLKDEFLQFSSSVTSLRNSLPKPGAE